MKGIFFASVLVAGLVLSRPLAPANAEEKCDNPLPDVRVSAPGPDVPKEIAQFSGIWKGKWGARLCSTLVVETVDKDGIAELVYSWGRGRNFEPGYFAPNGKIRDEKLTFGTRAKFTFWITKEGNLAGKRVAGTGRSYVTMQKVH